MVISIKNTTLNAQNSGTLGRLILGLLINSDKKIKLLRQKFIQKRFQKSCRST